MMIRKSEIHIFIPAFNEASTIGHVIRSLQQLDYQNIKVIDDGSTDQTDHKAMAAGATVIRHFINRGAGAATQTAIEYARTSNCSYLLLMDADGQHLAKDLKKLVEQMEKGNSDIVIGSRFLHPAVAMPGSRKWLNYLGNQLTNLMCQQKYTDSQSGFRMLNRRAIGSLNLTLDEFGFCSEMLFLAEKANLKIAEVPIEAVYTPYSLQKGQNFFTGVQTAFSFLRRILLR